VVDADGTQRHPHFPDARHWLRSFLKPQLIESTMLGNYHSLHRYTLAY
jgi:hypothetical protein